MGELSNTTINGVSYDFKDAGAARQSHSHTKSQITDFPTSMPASDVSAWAKASTKPTYNASEVGAAAASDVAVSYISPGDFFTPYDVTTIQSSMSLTKQGKRIFGFVQVKAMSTAPILGTVKTPYRPPSDVTGMVYVQNANRILEPQTCLINSNNGTITTNPRWSSGSYVYFYVDYIIA